MTLTVAGEPLIAYLLASVRIVRLAGGRPAVRGTVGADHGQGRALASGWRFAVAPQLADGDDPGWALPSCCSTSVTQVVVGAAMGFVTYLLFAAVAAAGSLIDVFGGFSLAQGFDPLSMNMNTVFGKFHQMLATDAALRHRRAPAGHRRAAQAFDFLPLGEMPDVERRRRTS